MDKTPLDWLKFLYGAVVGGFFGYVTLVLFFLSNPIGLWLSIAVIASISGYKWMKKGPGHAFRFLLILLLIEAAYVLLLLTTCSYTPPYS